MSNLPPSVVPNPSSWRPLAERSIPAEPQPPLFNFVRDFPNISKPAAFINPTTLEQKVYLLPIQDCLEKWIFHKYVQYNKIHSPFKIFQSANHQMEYMYATIDSIHPDFRGVVGQVFVDCFPQYILNYPCKLRPKKKFCPNCKTLLPTEQFNVARSNKDSFSRLCIRCQSKPKSDKPIMYTQEQVNELLRQQLNQQSPPPNNQPPPTNNPEDLDHDIFDDTV